MKNIIRSLVIFGVLFQSLAAYSQIGFTASLKGGVSLGKMHYEEDVFPEEFDRSFNLGPNIGATFGIALTDLIELETGIGFIRKGEKLEGRILFDPIDFNYEMTYTFDYLTIPALVKIKPPIFQGVNLYGIAGASIGIPLSAKMNVKADTMGVTFIDTTYDVKDEVKMDFGLNVGAGVEFKIGNFLPFVEFIYDFGLADIIKPEEETEETKEATRTILLSAGIKYNF